MSRSIKHCYRFGAFLLNPQSRILLRAGQLVPLTPKAFETLLVLVEQSGEVVTRQDLITAVWPDTHVVEGTLNSNIFALRRVLADGQPPEAYIATVPRRGYRFIADVDEVGCTSPERYAAEHESAIGAEMILEGSIQRVCDRFHINLRLVCVNDGAPKGTDGTDERLEEIFARCVSVQLKFLGTEEVRSQKTGDP